MLLACQHVPYKQSTARELTHMCKEELFSTKVAANTDVAWLTATEYTALAEISGIDVEVSWFKESTQDIVG